MEGVFVSLSRFRAAALAAFAIAALPAAAVTQQPTPPSPELQQQVQGMLQEMQQLSGQLQQLHSRAMRDPGLTAAHNSLSQVIRQAMVRADPTLEQAMQRLQQLDAQAAEARTAGNQARFRELEQEAVAIQQRFAAAQQQAVQRQPELVGQMQAFQTQVEAKMVELDPQAERLIRRMNQLQTQLAGIMQAQAQAQGQQRRP
jgi:DNA repair exonuclease SbcCD ATPase subunit